MNFFRGWAWYFLTQFQIFNVPPQGGSFAYSPLGAICLKSRYSSRRFCAGLHDRYPIVSYTNGKLWARPSPWCTPLLVFLAFSNRISVFRKKRISRISLWQTGRDWPKTPNDYPDLSIVCKCNICFSPELLFQYYLILKDTKWLQLNINGRSVWLFCNAIGAITQCPYYNWGVGSDPWKYIFLPQRNPWLQWSEASHFPHVPGDKNFLVARLSTRIYVQFKFPSRVLPKWKFSFKAWDLRDLLYNLWQNCAL